MKKIRLNIVGAGNVSCHLVQGLSESCEIKSIYSRDIRNATELAKKIGAKAIDSLTDLSPDVDLNIIALADNAIAEIISEIPSNIPVCHTSGSISLDVFKGFQHYGILYPLQTFSKNRRIDLAKVPFLLEANGALMNELLEKIVQEKFKAAYKYCDSKNRKIIHLAAVYACNFTTLMMQYANTILENNDEELELLKPLVTETMAKSFELGPQNSMTGPAKRGDTEVMENHLSLLKDQKMREIYALLSEEIRNS